LFLNLFVCFCAWSEEEKFYYYGSDSDIASEEDKLGQSLQLLTSPSDYSTFPQMLHSSDASERRAYSDHDVDILVDLSSDLVPNLISLSFA